MGLEFLDNTYSDEETDAFIRLISFYLEESDKKSFLEKGPIVDLGCGNGTLLHKLKGLYPNIECIGVDRKPYRKYPDITYLTADITRTGLVNESSRIVITVNIQDYVGDSFTKQSFFNEVNRILIPNGIYIPLEPMPRELIEPFVSAGYRSFGRYFQEKH